MNEFRIITEAPGDDNQANDYSAEADKEIKDAGNANATNDYSTNEEKGNQEDEEQPEATDYTSDAENVDAEGTDDQGDPGEQGDEGGDYSNDSGGGEEQKELSEDELKEKDKQVKQALLLKQMIELYNSVKTYNKKVVSLDKSNLIFSMVQNKVSKNFVKLYNLIYRYIMYYYDNMSYEYNLYAYNYFIEATKINIEMIKKILNKDETVDS